MIWVPSSLGSSCFHTSPSSTHIHPRQPTSKSQCWLDNRFRLFPSFLLTCSSQCSLFSSIFPPDMLVFLSLPRNPVPHLPQVPPNSMFFLTLLLWPHILALVHNFWFDVLFWVRTPHCPSFSRSLGSLGDSWGGILVTLPQD